MVGYLVIYLQALNTLLCTLSPTESCMHLNASPFWEKKKITALFHM